VVIYIRGDKVVENSFARKFIQDNSQVFDKYKHALSESIKQLTPELYEKFEKFNIFLKLTDKNSYNISAEDVDVFKGVLHTMINTTDFETLSSEHVHVFKDELAQEYVLALIMPKDNYYNLREPLYEIFFAQAVNSNGYTNLILNVNDFEAFKALMALIVPSALPIHWNECKKHEDYEELDLDI